MSNSFPITYHKTYILTTNLDQVIATESSWQFYSYHPLRFQWIISLLNQVHKEWAPKTNNKLPTFDVPCYKITGVATPSQIKSFKWRLVWYVCRRWKRCSELLNVFQSLFTIEVPLSINGFPVIITEKRLSIS